MVVTKDGIMGYNQIAHIVGFVFFSKLDCEVYIMFKFRSISELSWCSAKLFNMK